MSESPAHQLVVEVDPAHVSVYGTRADSLRRALGSAVVTLTLGVLGSTILPVPYAFSKLGIAPGAATMAIVAFANDRTCCMLVRASAATGRCGYEALAEWAGGRRARVLTQVSLILLLYGTMCGGLAFLSDVARIMVLKGLPASDQPPPPATGGGAVAGASWWQGWLELARRDGRPVMLLVVACVLYPLCLQRYIRQFERAATVGVVVVITLMTLVIAKAVLAGFPAVASGELPVWGLKKGAHEMLPEAFAVLGFAFYMQPMLMPLLAEMPGGPAGVAVSEKAVHTVLYGVACAAYGTVGIFGASLFGDATESNIMVNELLPGHPWYTLLLYGALMGYLCCGMVTTQFALRASIEVLLFGDDKPPFTWTRQVAETTCILIASLAIACSFPTAAEKIFAVTGCTAVCLVCYCIPVYIHLVLRSRLAWAVRGGPAVELPYSDSAVQVGQKHTTPDSSTNYLQLPPTGEEEFSGPHDGHSGAGVTAASNGGLQEPLLHAHDDRRSRASQLAVQRLLHAKPGQVGCWQWCCDMALPLFIVAVGVGCSLAGLWVAAVDIARGLNSGS
uniref:Amino acid transporter transmembrane domain-containing protein n=1 Tax=Chlamydomonas leiostraca TaxID=1034604 RepID=A0A7S0S1I6_9CHLO|mmetsp:Transcript_38135/g.96470  ORF Transcript_38135/g.96470 Transcript_38135/m.96470 type:complete len:562 (+) Transcript_38135:234-1919(+)